MYLAFGPTNITRIIWNRFLNERVNDVRIIRVREVLYRIFDT